MNSLKEYIIEKFKISKDISNKEIKAPSKKDIEYLTDLYKKGDKCLYLSQRGLKSQTRIHIEAIKISKVSKTIIEYIPLTMFNTYYNSQAKFIIKSGDAKAIDRYNYACASGMTTTSMIIPIDDCEYILDKIEKDNMKLDFYNILWKSGTNPKFDNRENVVKFKDGVKKYDSSFDDYEKITSDDIDGIKNILGI